MAQAEDWMQAATSGDPPTPLIHVWVGAVRQGNEGAYGALLAWLQTVARERGWPEAGFPETPPP